MERGLYIAASGMLAEQIRQDQIANDLANASTPGYKADRTSQSGFGDLLLANSATGATVGSQGTAVQVSKIETDFSPKPARETGEPLDFAIVGEGFFSVQTDRGTRYTRNGQFTADAQGRLVTAQGDPVLGRNGSPLSVGRDGRVDPRNLQIVNLGNPRKDGDSLVAGTPVRQRRRAGPRGRPRGLRRRRVALDGRHDLVHARLRGGPEGHPDHRRDAGQGREPGRRHLRLTPGSPLAQVPRSRADLSGSMLEGLNSAAAGMAAQQQRLDSVANDLANANTTGYKHNRVGFRDLVYQQAGRASAQGVRTGHGAAAVDAGKAFSQGGLQRTDRPLDVADPGRRLPARSSWPTAPRR